MTLKRPILHYALYILASVLFQHTASAEEYTVDQKNKKFSIETLNAQVGDTVHFLNSDRFFHNIYSISEAKSFDLGSYPKGKSRSITVDKPGTIEVRCAIHPGMKMKIIVSD